MKNSKRKVAIILIIVLFIILLALTMKVVIDKTNAYGYGDSNGAVKIVREGVDRINVTAPEGYTLSYQIVDISDEIKKSINDDLNDLNDAQISLDQENSKYNELDSFIKNSLLELNTSISEYCKISINNIGSSIEVCKTDIDKVLQNSQETYNNINIQYQQASDECNSICRASGDIDSGISLEACEQCVNNLKINEQDKNAAFDAYNKMQQKAANFNSLYPNAIKMADDIESGQRRLEELTEKVNKIKNDISIIKSNIGKKVSPPTTGDYQTVTDNYVKPDFSTSKSSKILWVKSEYNGQTYYDFDIIPAIITGQSPIYLDSQDANNKGTENIYVLVVNNSMSIYIDTDCKNEMTSNSNKITIPTKENNTFEGYYTEEDGKGSLVITKDGYLVDNFDTVRPNLKNILYAKWTPTTENKDDSNNSDNKTEDDNKKDDNTSNNSQGNNKVPTTENKNEITSSGNNSSIIVVDDELKEIIKDYTSSEVSNEEKDRIKDNLFSDSEDIYVFDTNIKDKDGKDIDLNGKEVTVKTPLPDGMIPTDNIKVYEIIDGEKNDISFDIVDNKIVFKISKMGKYAIVKYPKNVDINNPQTGDINLSLLIGGIIISGALLIITIVYIIKNKKNKI